MGPAGELGRGPARELPRLIALRRSSDALARGGIRYAHVGDDAIAYLRERGDERLLCLAARAAHEPVRLSLAALGATRARALCRRRGACALPASRPCRPTARRSTSGGCT